LNACFGVTIKLACETEDFYLVLFTNLKHGGMYLRLWKGCCYVLSEPLYIERSNSPMVVMLYM
jgi:hypothetical protein